MANVTTSNRNNNSKVNPAKFMGSTFAAGSALSKKVDANAKKITLIKKVLQAQRIAIGEQLKPTQEPLIDGVKEQLKETNSILKDIGNALALDFANRIAEEKEDNKNLKEQKDKMRKSFAEKTLEGLKGVGKGIGKGIGKVGSMAPTFGFAKLIQAIGMLGAGITANAAFEWLRNPENIQKLKDIFNWTKEHFDKILMTAGALFVGDKLLGVVGLVSVLTKIAGIFKSPWLIGPMLFMFGKQFGEKGDLSWFQKKAIKSLGRDYKGDKDALIADLESARSGDRRDLHKKFGLQSGPLSGRSGLIDTMIEAINDYEASEFKEKAMGGETLGLTLVGERGPELAYFGHKANIVANHNMPKFLDDISNFSKSKVNIIEMDLGTIKKQPSTKEIALPKATEVNYVPSVNIMNSYMTKTPELHGICA